VGLIGRSISPLSLFSNRPANGAVPAPDSWFELTLIEETPDKRRSVPASWRCAPSRSTHPPRKIGTILAISVLAHFFLTSTVCHKLSVGLKLIVSDLRPSRIARRKLLGIDFDLIRWQALSAHFRGAPFLCSTLVLSFWPRT
jgi:hypothetical protein